ncbi:tRNA (uracil) methyltransferase [Aspergillus saccharolyticus JOP 1030-1]|uniref:tRNA (uracil-O(2)-)-methyltransferase n=1 Tax=Aspergillus saccharolyticus JOP 1030-1 TaxID=1450539 RepID=A0A318ZCX9_9EURO|nr:DUF1613-domain-containing protein [Aspergillus saccharolyticus JOP 1030-1]PYH45351.1 DUF1613-domain-containing protein [Aspergillus saccharolyticus JOP 1030-1]
MTRTSRKPPRDPAQLSGKPLAETLEPSPVLHSETEDWTTSQDLTEYGLSFVPEVMQDLTLYLLANPNVNSSHLFRADILFDSEGILRTPREKAQSFALTGNANADVIATTGVFDGDEKEEDDEVGPIPAREVPGFSLSRTVVRRLVPRNPKLDRTLDQTCHFYEAETSPATGGREQHICRRSLVIYTPHITKEEEIPYYHPALRSLAYLYDYNTSPGSNTDPSSTPGEPPQDTIPGPGTLTLHTLLFPSLPITNRLERTLQALLNTQIRLARTTRLPTPSSTSPSTPQHLGANKNPLKDNILPQHLVQNTYTRLKAKYASDLCQNWVETTEPSKHVFEDLSIAAFLIELWRSMYGVVPEDERGAENPHTQDAATITATADAAVTAKFPGFVDVACGNGVLVYILFKEGYEGWGFDARRRKTWEIFPARIQTRLREEIYVPRPFHDAMMSKKIDSNTTAPHHPSTDTGEAGGVDAAVDANADAATDTDSDTDPFGVGIPSHTGQFPKHTFIISNHADELTVWTPLMAALLSPDSPSPFVAIPCCSHSLSGAKYRYPPPKPVASSLLRGKGEGEGVGDGEGVRQDKQQQQQQQQQPAAGDLKTLRKERQDAQSTEAGFLKSMYGSLTAKTKAVAEEVGFEVEKTLLRIPSTRNMAVVGGRRVTTQRWKEGLKEDESSDAGAGHIVEKVMAVVHRECQREGGVEAAAKIWIDRARGINKGPGMGKQRGSH